MLTRHHLGSFFIVAQVVLCANLFGEPDDRPPDVSPAANVDESLFLVRAIGHECALWPKNPWDGKAALKYCEEGRVHVKFLRSIAVRDGADPGVRVMCNDFITLIDEYEATLARQGEINDKAVKDAIGDAVNSFMRGGIKGLAEGAKADREGKSELETDAAVAKGLIDDGLKVYINHAQARDQATANSVEAERARFGDVVNFATQHNAKTVEAIAQRRNWAAGEGGFDLPAGTALDVLAARRPRDPFARLDLAAAGIDEKTTGEDLVARANMCLDAARLVPAGATFDSYRVQFVSIGMGYACSAADIGLEKTYKDLHTQYSQNAINIGQALLQLDPQDADGWVHLQLFRAYSDAGRLAEAVAAARPLLDSDWGKSLSFTIRYARVMGAQGDADAADHWLRVSYALGFANVDFVKTSADFGCLRTQKPDAYAEVTTLKGSSSVPLGFFADDVLIKNTSPFPMTNVKIECTVIADGKVLKRERTIPYVAGNSQESIDSVFPSGNYDVYRWTLTCDQGSLSSEADGQ